jgi:hypothetical protein
VRTSWLVSSIPQPGTLAVLTTGLTLFGGSSSSLRARLDLASRERRPRMQ